MFANKYTSTNAHAAMNEDAGNRTRKASVQHLQFGAVGNLLDACMHAAGDYFRRPLVLGRIDPIRRSRSAPGSVRPLASLHRDAIRPLRSIETSSLCSAAAMREVTCLSDSSFVVAADC